MGLLDVHARTWNAPTHSERQHKQELHRLEDAEHAKQRSIKHELETLEKVEELRREGTHHTQELLNAHERRRAISGLEDSQRLALMERENQARLLNSAHLSPAHSMMSSPMMGGSQYAASPMLGVGGHTPRARSVSGIGMGAAATADLLARERLAHANAQRHATSVAAASMLSPHSATLSPFPSSPHVRTRAVSGSGLHHGLASPAMSMSGGHMSGAQMERMKLEAKKAELLDREHRLEQAKLNRLKAQASAVDLGRQERALRDRERDLLDRTAREERHRLMDREEARLRNVQHEMELEDQLRRLSVNTPSLNPLNVSPGRGHARHLSSPGLAGMGIPNDPMLSSPLLAGGGGGHHLGNGAGLLSPQGYSPTQSLGGGLGHGRSRSHSSVGLGGSGGIDPGLLAEARSLGIPMSPSLGNHPGGLGGMSPRMAAFPSAPSRSPRMSMSNDFEDDLLAGGGLSRSRRGSLSSPMGMGMMNEFGGVGAGNGEMYDMPPMSRSRRGSLAGGSPGLGQLDGYQRGRLDSLPFDERPLFDTRGY